MEHCCPSFASVTRPGPINLRRPSLRLLTPLMAAVMAAGTGCGEPQKKSEFEPLKLETPGANVAYYKVGEDYLAGQLPIEGFENAQKQGIKTVVNLRPSDEQTGFDERKIVETLGMSYVNIPVSSKSLAADKADQFLYFMKTAQRPVIVHCGSANRASGFWALYLVKEKSVPPAEAVALAEKTGLRAGPVKTFVESYIERLPKAAVAVPPAAPDAKAAPANPAPKAE
jgi:uncharacterized protein (TIGR01244 family)